MWLLAHYLYLLYVILGVITLITLKVNTSLVTQYLGTENLLSMKWGRKCGPTAALRFVGATELIKVNLHMRPMYIQCAPYIDGVSST
jgi:hypothetical protein